MTFMGITGRQLTMVIVMICGTFVAILNQTLITPALPAIMAEFAIDAATAQWLTTGFTLVNAIMIPITAFLTDRFTIKRLFIIAMAVFTLGTALCAWAPSFIVLLIGRLVQAAGAGILMPLVMTVFMWTFPIEQRGTAMGMFGLIVAFAPAIGPTVAGIVVDHTSWHNLFVVLTLLALAMIILAIVAIRHEENNTKDVHLDILSVILSSFGFGGLLYGLSAIGSTGLTIDAIIGLIGGAIILVFFFRRQLHMEQPMLQVRVLSNRTFLISTVMIMIIQSSLMAGSILLPIYLQTLMGFSATDTGLAILPGAIITGAMGPVAGRLFDRYGPRVLSIVGLSLLVASTFCLGLFNTGTSFAFIVLVYTVRMFAMSLVNMPLNTWGMNALSRDLVNHGTSVNNTFRQVAGSLGTAILVSIYTIVGSMCSGDMGARDASIFGFDVAFFVGTGLCLIAFFMALFLVKNRKSTKDKLAKEADKENKHRTLMESVMKSNVFTLQEDATVIDAMQLFVDKDISAAPIVDKDNEPIGFISDGDIMRRLPQRSQTYVDPVVMVTQTIESESADTNLMEKLDQLMSANVCDIGVKKAISVDIHTDMVEVCKVLADNHLKKVAVTDEGHLVGMINRSDIIQATMETYLENSKAGTLPTPEKEPEEQVKEESERKAKEAEEETKD